MYQPVRQNTNKVQTAQAVSLPASTQGWNVRESIANMDPTYAYILNNWFPTTSDIVERLGSVQKSTGLNDENGNPAQVNTVMVYKPAAGAEQMFGAASQYIYNSTAVGPATVEVSGLTNSMWQYVNYTTLGGSYLLAVNGSDPMEVYNGTTWQAVTGVSSPFAITGVDTSTFSSINVHMNRVWFVQAGSQQAWYLPFNSVGGAATLFQLNGVFQKGGFLVAMGTWTSDGGTGLADYAVFITSQGEVAVYQGTDPSGIDTWELLGVYNIGIPIGGPRCYKKYGSDILILTSDGVIPGSQAFASGRTTEKIALTDVIQGAFAKAVNLYQTSFGWEFTQFPLGNMLVVNVPIGVGSQVQYVMNTQTGAWCSFSGWPVNAFGIHNDDLYGGTLGAINQYWIGPSDFVSNPPVINLNAADAYGVIAATTITSVPTTTINGNLALSPGSSVTGGPIVTGETNIDNPAAVAAVNNASNAFIAGNALTPSTTIPAALGGTSPAPGIYNFTGGAATLTGTVTLNGGPNSVWIFQIASTLITATSSSVVLAGGAQAANVYWLVGSSATLGVSSVFKGTIIAHTSITVDTGALVSGHLFALTGAVTLDANVVTASSNPVVSTPTNIVFEWQPAWSYYGSRTQLKNFKLWRPVFEYDVPPNTVAVGFDVDYQSKVPMSLVTNLPTGTGALWDVGIWDVSIWGGSSTFLLNWLTANGYPGFSAAPHILGSSQVGTLHLEAIDVVYASCGVL